MKSMVCLHLSQCIKIILFSEDFPSSKKIQTLDDEVPSTSGSSGKYVLKSLPKTISKNKDKDVPLPNPIPLPKNYRSDVTAALETGQMTHDTESATDYQCFKNAANKPISMFY